MKTIRIGKQVNNDYVVNDDTVSRYHAQMTVTDSGEVFIKDLGSTNGTFVDGKRIQVETKLISGNVVRIGNRVINWLEISQKRPDRTVIQNGEKSVVNTIGRYLIGRDEKCQIRFPQSEVSGRHAMLEKNVNGEPQISDLDSTNGTFVNGQRIFSTKILHKGDVVLLANKFPLLWEQYIPACTSTKRNEGGMRVSLRWVYRIAACLAILLFLGGGLFIYHKSRAWSPEEVYETYKGSIVFIKAYVHYSPYYHGKKLSEILTDDFEVYNVDGLQVVKRMIGWNGSGAVVSNDGLIVTNRHVANFTAADDNRNKEKIKKKVKEDLALLYNKYLHFYSQANRQQKNQIAEILAVLETIYKTDEEIVINLEYDFLGVAFNDTHISGLKDLQNCSFIRNHPDNQVDAALIQLNSKKSPDNVNIVDIVNYAEPQNMKLGSRIYSIGFPYAEEFGKTDIGLEANNQSGEITQEYGDILYGHNIVIKGGASGSPVFDSHGRFAGLIVSTQAAAGGVGYNQSIRPERVAELMK